MHKLPAAITLLELMDYKTQGVKGVIVALRNKEVRIYRGKFLINMLEVDVSWGWGYVAKHTLYIFVVILYLLCKVY